MVMSEEQTREQHRGISQVGVQEQRSGAGSLRRCFGESNGTSSEYQNQRLGLLCRAIGEAHRRLEYTNSQPDLW